MACIIFLLDGTGLEKSTKNQARFVVYANFHGINIPIMADFKLVVMQCNEW